MIEPLLGYDEMASELNLTVRSLRDYARRGIVPHLRLGHRTVKFQRSKVAKALAKREVKAVV